MRSLLAPTEDFVRLDNTKLSADVESGTNVSLPVYGDTSFEENDYICIGMPGSLTAEIQKIASAVSDETDMTVATLLYSHKADEPVQKFRYNQRKFYGSLTETGAYSELTDSGSPKDITVNDPQGTLFEYSGDEGYLWFKSTYWNSSSSEETDIADAIAVSADQSSRYCTLYQIRFQAGMQDNPYVDDAMFESYRQQAENEVNSYLYNRYVLPLQNMEQGQEIPNLVERATILLAAGYCDYREYGKTGEGVKWLGEARGILNAIQNGKQRLIGSDFNELLQKEKTHGIQSNSTGKYGGCDRPMFTTKQNF